MATVSRQIPPVPSKLREIIPNTKILVVGAGGIGCEVLKNLSLSGFKDLEVVDLDTIDISNLNRQFLFRREHVGKPKATTAKESILDNNPNMKITAYHDSILSSQYGVNFFKKFNIVLNALDNRTARNHVNRMCLAADVPLLESGTSGYSGQVEFIKKGMTQCYECQPKAVQRTFPGCTIRNTPSEPAHCIVWAKHLFNQIFGEDDPDQDVSPDKADPEANEEGINLTETGNLKRVSTRQWVQDENYDPEKLFNKFFFDDITYLLKMENLWKKRTPPKPLSWDDALKLIGDYEKDSQDDDIRTTDMSVWSIAKCAKVFADSIAELRKDLVANSCLVWDKDDKPGMDLVAACANIRSYIFSIPQKSRFDAKSIAGNIIPAIATSNAMVAGLVVLYTFRVLLEEYKKCPTIYLRKKTDYFPLILRPDQTLSEPIPHCYSCSPKPFVSVFVDLEKMKVKDFESEILKKHLNMVAPDVVLDGKGVVLISSEEGETEINNEKKLAELDITDGCILKCDDFLQNYELTLAISHYVPSKTDEFPFKIIANPDELKARETENGDKNASSVTKEPESEDSDDLIEVDEEDPEEGSSRKKRKIDTDNVDDDIVEIP